MDDVFSGVLQKLKERITQYLPMKSRFTMAERVCVANMYLVPVFSYLFRFYMMSPTMEKFMKTALRLWLVSHNATSVEHLCASRENAGLSSPLRDPYAINTVSLLRNRMVPQPPYPSARKLEESMFMSDHIKLAAARFRSITGEEAASNAPQRALMCVHESNRDDASEELIASYRRRRNNRKWRGLAVPAREVKELVKCVLKNAAALPQALAPALRNHAFCLVHRSLPTRHSTSWMDLPQGTLCVLCGVKRETIEHLLTECKLTQEIIDRMHASLEPQFREYAAVLSGSSYSDYRLESKSVSQSDMITRLSFALAIWCARWAFYRGTGVPDATMVVSHAAHSFRTWRSRPTKWARRDRKDDADRFRDMCSALPLGHNIYTDGSAFNRSPGQPGPAGAGFVIYPADSDDTVFYSQAMEETMCNQAELEAVTALGRHLEQKPLSPDFPIYIFVDNTLCISTITGRAFPPWVEDAKLAQQLLGEVAEVQSVHLFWVPGHANIEGNEIADALAKRGASGITSYDSVNIDSKQSPQLTPQNAPIIRPQSRRHITPSNPPRIQMERRQPLIDDYFREHAVDSNANYISGYDGEEFLVSQADMCFNNSGARSPGPFHNLLNWIESLHT